MPLMAVSTIVLATAWACGGDGGNVEPNTPPVAVFTAPVNCTAAVACTFSDASTDDHGVTSREWDFGDATEKVTVSGSSTTHTYAEANDYTVTLKVTDAAGETNSVSHTVTVGTGATANLPPVASFTSPACIVNTDCTFTSTSTDADGQVSLVDWAFGKKASLDGARVTHQYATAADYSVVLTVTDDDGATNAVTQTVTASSVAAQDCTASGSTEVICTISIAQASKVQITLISVSCELGGNRLFVPPPKPRAQTIFTNLCSQIPPQVYTLKDDTGADLVFEAGTQLPIQFHRGEPDIGGGDPPAGIPQAHLEPTSATAWTINIDDGGDPTGVGEPDFTDVILSVELIP